MGVVFAADLAQAQTARPLERITFLLDFRPAYGKHAPFFAALDKGFWKDAGFDGTIVKGEGSATTIASYAAGAVDFAVVDSAVAHHRRGPRREGQGRGHHPRQVAPLLRHARGKQH